MGHCPWNCPLHVILAKVKDYPPPKENEGKEDLNTKSKVQEKQKYHMSYIDWWIYNTVGNKSIVGLFRKVSFIEWITQM